MSARDFGDCSKCGNVGKLRDYCTIEMCEICYSERVRAARKTHTLVLIEG